MDLYKVFGTNTQREAEGIKIFLSTEPEEIYFVLARAGGNNKKYQELLTKMLAPYKRQLDMGTLNESISKKIMTEVFCKTCLLNWKGVKSMKGELLGYSIDSAIDLMNDLPDLYTYLWGETQKLINFQDPEMEEIAKNL